MACSDTHLSTAKLQFGLLALLIAIALVTSSTRAYALLASTTTVTSSANPSAFGENITFTATVTGTLVTPTGTVTFKDGATTIGSGVLNGSGQTSFSTTTLSTGSHSITAVYSGDIVYNVSTSTVLTQEVVANSTSTSVVSSANPSAFEQSVIFTATVTSAGGTPTGTVTFKDGTTTLGTGTLDGSGQTTLATSVLLPGNHSITAVYSGDSNFAAGSSPVLTQAVNLGTSSTAVISSVNPSSVGQSVTFTATVSGLVIQPTGTVTFKDGATTLGTGNLDAGGHATFTTSMLSAGSHSITAVYGGDSLYNSSTSNLLIQDVNQNSTTTTVVSSSNPSALGAPVTFTASVSGSGGTPTGTVTIKDGGTTLGTGTLDGAGNATFSTSSLSAGSHSITAVYGGDSNYLSSTSPALTQNVVSNASSTSITSSVNPSTFGQSVTFTATVTGSSGTPTGSVTFKDGSATLGTATLDGSGQATFSTSSLAGGSHSITAVYGGDASYATSTSPVLVQNVSQTSSATSVASSANPSAYGMSVTFTATVTVSGGTPTGTVTFKDGSTILGTGTLGGGGQAALSTSSLSVGSHSITAVYGGDSNFVGSTSPVLTQVVGQNSVAVHLKSSVNPSETGQAVTFAATVIGAGVTPTGSVTFKDGSAVLGAATLGGGTASLTISSLAAGTHSITAVYSGDSSYASTSSQALLQLVQVPADSIKLRTLQVSVTKIAAQVSGQAISSAIDSAVADGFADSCKILVPAGIGFHFTTCPERRVTDRASRALAAFDESIHPAWLAWVDVRGAGWDTYPSKGDVTGHQLNGLAGVTRRLNPDLITGMLGGYESFNYSSQILDGQMHGDGWTLGGYLGLQLASSVRFASGFAYSSVSYRGRAGTANGSFVGNRILAKVGLTGSYRISPAWSLEPSARVYALRETDNAYVDSLGTVQAGRSFTTGRASAGGRLTYLWQSPGGTKVSPYLGLYADYYFSVDEDAGTLLPAVPTIDGASARLTSGVSFLIGRGSNVSVDGEVGGLGSDSFRTWTIRVRSSVAF